MTSDPFNKSFSRRLSLNKAILDKAYWYLPVDDKGHENFVPVGRGVKTSDWCGRCIGLSVCRNVPEHEGHSVGGVDATGKVVIRLRHTWCHKSSCPVCFSRGWSVREARSMQSRIEEGVRLGLGVPEHITVSVPVADRDLLEPVMRRKSWEALRDRGCLGAGLMFHGYRIDGKRRVLVWSPHYHAIGFIDGGFDCCRECSHEINDCRSCDGFKGREVRGFATDGYLVKVHDRRKTVFGTSHYQLNHATIRLGIKRFQVVTWWGTLSNRKFKSATLQSQDVCSVCHQDMIRAAYVGKRRIVRDVGVVGYVPVFVDDAFNKLGEPNYVDLKGGGSGE
jgi:hypothetical protein